MKMPNITPGPWFAENSGCNGWEIKGMLGNSPSLRNFVEFTYSSTKPIRLFVEPWHQFPNAEWNAMTQANAQAIAAVPELLNLAETIVRSGDVRWIRMAQAALLKAGCTE